MPQIISHIWNEHNIMPSIHPLQILKATVFISDAYVFVNNTLGDNQFSVKQDLTPQFV